MLLPLAPPSFLPPPGVAAWQMFGLPAGPGVAFDLTSDYGTAAIYFSNGSYAEVARIEGSPEYKAFMRTQDAPRSPSSAHPNLLCSTLWPSLYPLTFGLYHKHPHVAGTEALLLDLKASVESRVDTALCYADVGVADIRREYQTDVIEKAVEAVGLRQTRRKDRTFLTPAFALIPNVGSSDDQAPLQVVLSVDYSRSGLNAVLFLDDGGLLDVGRQEYYSSTFGTDSREVGEQDQAAEAEAANLHWKAVKAVLEKVVRRPFPHSSFASREKPPHHIEHLVLYGDAVHDPDFLQVLRAVLGQELVEKARAFDPVYAGSVGMASASYEKMRWIDFDIRPAFGCLWRSNLYRDEDRDL